MSSSYKVDLSHAKNFAAKVIALSSPYWFKKSVSVTKALSFYLLSLLLIVLSLEIPSFFIMKRDKIISWLSLEERSWAKIWQNISFENHFREIILWLTPKTFEDIVPQKLLYTEFYIQSIWFIIIFGLCYFVYKSKKNKLTTQSQASFLLLFNVITTIYVVKCTVQFATWYRDFYNALQNKDAAAFWQLIILFLVIAFVYITVQVIQLYYRLFLQIDWRRFMTSAFNERWLNAGTHYHMEVHNNKADNPDQRLTEDVSAFTETALLLSLDLFKTIYTLVAFLLLLWNQQPDIEIAEKTLNSGFFGYLVTHNAIGPFMVLCALAYAILGTLGAHFIASPLIRLFFMQQKYEADFRYSLMRIRENAEGISLYRGENSEKKILDLRFDNIVHNWWSLVKYQKRLLAYRSFYGQLAIIFPLMIASPLYFIGVISFGLIFTISRAFGEIRESFSWFLDNYATLANWKSVSDRLLTFESAMNHSEKSLNNKKLQLNEGQDYIEFSHLNILLNDNRCLIKAQHIRLNQGEKILITGASGSGKSTLIRTIAGLWPYAEGEIKRPSHHHMLFVPQKLYLPLGTLKEAVCYPKKANDFTDEKIIALLDEVHLSHLNKALHEQENWAHRLSPGEQQRLAAVRIILNKPQWLILDEATSALDEGIEYKIYSLIIEALQGSTIISVAHKPSVRQFHNIELKINNQQLEKYDITD